VLRQRIPLLLVAAFAAAFLLLGWRVDTVLRSDLTALTRAELRNAARLAVLGIAQQPFSDSLAARLAADTDLRISLIGPDGIVLGDSEVPARRLPSVENHADRPEVADALAGREGFDSRASETVNRRLHYLALPHLQGVVRVSRPADEERSILASVRGVLILGSVATLLLAFGLGRLLTRVQARDLEVLRETAEAIVSGDHARRSRPIAKGVLGALGRAVDDMADRLEEALEDARREKADLDALFESSEDGLAVLDDRQAVRRANRAFREIAGREEIEGERLVSLFRSAEVRRAADLALAGEAVDLETRVRERTMLISAFPRREGSILVLRDLTALRRLEGVRRDFVANVSHELKTPLTTVMGFAEPIAEGTTDPEEARAFGRRILHNARRMRRLVDDLLDLSRIEAGGWQPNPDELDLGAIARDVWSSLEPAPQRRGIELVVPDEPLRGRADPGALTQILRNLLENAARYAPDDSEVVVTLEAVPGGFRVAVSDLGAGIPPVHQERIFERFYRVDPARSRDEGGTGLGLAIVKHLVAAHGGEVGIESDIGTGTTVWFTIPAGGRGSTGRGAEIAEQDDSGAEG
jgi:two-component system phosphate regulon sensor histidine kinase PhoR